MKRSMAWWCWLACGCALVLIALWTPETSARPQSLKTQGVSREITLGIDAANSKVRYSVESSLHTVHGTFTLKGGSSLHVDQATGKAGGEVTVSATSGDSGNSSRDQRMHKEILETQKYPDLVFRPTQVDGTLVREGTCDVTLRGVMLIHGDRHDIVAQVHADLGDGQWRGTAKFDVPYIQWGIKDPSNWLLKVKPIVHVDVELFGSQKLE